VKLRLLLPSLLVLLLLLLLLLVPWLASPLVEYWLMIEPPENIVFVMVNCSRK
jgi:hypothetical protein